MLDGCPQCPTLWIDLAALSQRGYGRSPASARVEASRAVQPVTPVPCPHCRTSALLAEELKGVSLARCPDCRGVALTRSALLDLIASAGGGRHGSVAGGGFSLICDMAGFLLEVLA
jgi:Zn-finger nucleic acid-binding protein